MESAIINAFSKLWNRVLSIIQDSFAYKIFISISTFLKAVVKNSFILGRFMNPVDFEAGTDGRFSNIFSGLSNHTGKILSIIGAGIGKFIKSSRIITVVYDFYSNVLFQPIRSFGIISVTSGTIYLALTGIFSTIGIRSIIAATVLILTGAILLTTEINLYDVLCNSRILKLILGREGNLDRLGLSDNRKKQAHYGLSVILGIIIATMPVFLPTLYAAAGTAAIVGVPVIIIWPITGIVALVLSIAFIPTLLAAGLILLIWIGVILNASVGKISFKGVLSKGKSVFVYIIITLSGGILSFAIADSFPIALIYILFISIVFLFMVLIKNTLSVKSIIFSAALAALATAIIGLYQYLTGNIEVGWIDSEMFEGMVRIYSTFENPNVYGEYLLFMIPFSLTLFFGSKRGLYKLMWAGAGLLMVAAMMLTMSRGCWIGLAAGVFIYFAIADRRFLWLFFAAVVIMPFVLPESIMARLLSIGNLEDSSSLYRLYIWLGTFSMLKDYWLTGVGLGTKAFSGIYSAYAYNGIIAPHPHNLYLNIISETGITGLIGFAWVSVLGVRSSISTAIKGNVFNRHLGAALAAAFTGFFVQGIFDNVFYNYRIVLMFWIFIALSFSFAIMNKRQETNG